jgi:hypothetical protein
MNKYTKFCKLVLRESLHYFKQTLLRHTLYKAIYVTELKMVLTCKVKIKAKKTCLSLCNLILVKYNHTHIHINALSIVWILARKPAYHQDTQPEAAHNYEHG